MKDLKSKMRMGVSALALSSILAGCAHEISHTKSTSVGSDGRVRSREKIVTQSPDGTVTTESKKSDRP